MGIYGKLPLNASSRAEWVGHSLWIPLKILSNDWRLTNPLLRKSYALRSRGRGVPTNVRGWRWVAGTLHRVDCSLVINLVEMAKPWSRTSHGRCTQHTAVWSPASVAKGCAGHLGCRSIRRMFKLSNQSPVSGKSYYLADQLIWSKVCIRVPWNQFFSSVWAPGKYEAHRGFIDPDNDVQF